MADCKLVLECLFYKDRLPEMPATSEFFKLEFCHKHPDRCARFLLHEKLGLKTIPDDVMPGDTHRVKNFLK